MCKLVLLIMDPDQMASSEKMDKSGLSRVRVNFNAILGSNMIFYALTSARLGWFYRPQGA